MGRGNLRGLRERRREDEFNGDAVQLDYSALYFVLLSLMDKKGKETGRVNPKKIKERKGMCILKSIVDQLGLRFF